MGCSLRSLKSECLRRAYMPPDTPQSRGQAAPQPALPTTWRGRRPIANCVAGAAPAPCRRRTRRSPAPIKQSVAVEHILRNDGVGGSNPSCGTSISHGKYDTNRYSGESPPCEFLATCTISRTYGTDSTEALGCAGVRPLNRGTARRYDLRGPADRAAGGELMIWVKRRRCVAPATRPDRGGW